MYKVHKVQSTHKATASGLVLFHHSGFKVGEVLSKHVLIEKYFTLIFQTNLFTPHQLSSGIAATWKTNKQIHSNFVPNTANHA